jgi:hypothetical protein
MAQRLTDTINACALHRHSIGATVRIRLTLSAAEGLKIRIKTHGLLERRFRPSQVSATNT